MCNFQEKKAAFLRYFSENKEISLYLCIFFPNSLTTCEIEGIMPLYSNAIS